MILIVWDKVGEIALKEIWQAVINILIKLEFEKPRPTIDNDTVLTCADTILLNWVLLRALWTLNWRRLLFTSREGLMQKQLRKHMWN